MTKKKFLDEPTKPPQYHIERMGRDKKIAVVSMTYKGKKLYGVTDTYLTESEQMTFEVIQDILRCNYLDGEKRAHDLCKGWPDYYLFSPAAEPQS